MPLPANLDQLTADELRRLVIEQDRELVWRKAKIEKLTHELALHKRWRFGVKTERWPEEQARLFEETVDADLAAIEVELEQLSPAKKDEEERRQPKRKPLPAELPRTGIHRLRLRLLDAADWRGCRREARLHARRLYRRAPHSG